MLCQAICVIAASGYESRAKRREFSRGGGREQTKKKTFRRSFEKLELHSFQLSKQQLRDVVKFLTTISKSKQERLCLAVEDRE